MLPFICDTKHDGWWRRQLYGVLTMSLSINASAVCNDPLTGTAVPASGKTTFLIDVPTSTRIFDWQTFVALSYPCGNRDRGPR
jgi:hypothetical protein